MRALGAITGLSVGWAIGACALALAPVVVHLLARGRAKRVVFPGQRFLAEAVATGRKASTPRDLATLLLRSAALACVALAFGGVAWSGAAQPDGQRLVIVLDASASMSRVEAGRSAFERGRERMLTMLDDPSLEQAAVVVARRTPTPLLPAMTANLDALRARAADVGQTLEGADLGAAASVAQSLRQEGAPARVVVLTDRQGAAAVAGAMGVEVIDCTLGPWTSNRAITDLRLEREPNGRLRAVVTTEAWGEAAPARVVVEVDGDPVGAREASPGGVLIVDLPSGAPGWAPVAARYETPDAAPWDDARFAVVAPDRSPSAALVTREDPDAPRSGARMLRAALNPFGGAAAEPPVTGPGDLPESGSLFIVGAGAWTDGDLDALASRLRAGAGALWIVDSSEAHDALRRLLGRHAPEDALRVGPAFEAGVYAELRAIASDGWTLGRSPVVEAPPARVALRFDDGSPALVRTPIGRGALVTLHCPVDPDRSSLARTPALPMLVEIVRGSVTPASPEMAAAVVGALRLPALSLRRPAPGATVMDSLDRPVGIGERGLRVDALDAPGAVLALLAGEPIGAGAAHVDPAESAPSGTSSMDSESPGDAEPVLMTASRTDLAPWLLLLGIALLCAEALAARGRRFGESSR